MKIKSQQSMYDMLLQIIPDLNKDISSAKTKVSAISANKLYSIWRDASKQIDNKKFRRPEKLSFAEVKLLESEGLVNITGDNIEITAKGSDIIKQMILGDQRSAFDSENGNIDYITALANLKPSRKMKKQGKFASKNPNFNNWYKKCQE